MIAASPSSVSSSWAKAARLAQDSLIYILFKIKTDSAEKTKTQGRKGAKKNIVLSLTFVCLVVFVLYFAQKSSRLCVKKLTFFSRVKTDKVVFLYAMSGVVCFLVQ